MTKERKVQSGKSISKPKSTRVLTTKIQFRPPAIFPAITILILLQYNSTRAQDSLRLAMNINPEIHSSLQELQMMVDQNISRLNPVESFDTTFTQTKPKLLPKNISFAENFLWGENEFFRKIGIASELTPEVRKRELEVRRAMLTAHQIGGFTTLGFMIAAAYFGQKVIDGHRNYGDIHQTLVVLTIGSYTLTGLLAILSPPPLIRRDNEESTTTIHKTLAWLHVAGMIITPILASYIGERRSFNMDKAHVHQISGYITTALFATSMIVVTF